MPNRKPIIAGNWKMNKTSTRRPSWSDELAQALPEVRAGVEVVCPPTIDITTVHDRIRAAPIALGAQNVYWEEKGAYTGESSCDMLKSAGCTYCIIGHSERRDYFHETDEDENKKAKALVAAGIVPVFCCGEPEEVREAGTYVKHVTDQVKAGLAGLEMKHVVSPTSPSGPSAPARPPRPTTPRRSAAPSARPSSSSSATSSPTASACSTAAPPSPATSPSSLPSPTWTAPLWAAPRSRLPTSPRWSSRRGSNQL